MYASRIKLVRKCTQVQVIMSETANDSHRNIEWERKDIKPTTFTLGGFWTMHVFVQNNTSAEPWFVCFDSYGTPAHTDQKYTMSECHSVFHRNHPEHIWCWETRNEAAWIGQTKCPLNSSAQLESRRFSSVYQWNMLQILHYAHNTHKTQPLSHGKEQ